MRNVENDVIINKENLIFITTWSTKNVSFAITEFCLQYKRIVLACINVDT